MDTGALYAALNSLDMVQVKRKPNGSFDGLREGSETLPVVTAVTNNLTGGSVLIGPDGKTINTGDSGFSGSPILKSFKNLTNTVTKILLPSAPQALTLSWSDSGIAGNLRFVLEAASSGDADSRLNFDDAHSELLSGAAPVAIMFAPTNNPYYLYVKTSNAIGAGSNVLSIVGIVPL